MLLLGVIFHLDHLTEISKSRHTSSEEDLSSVSKTPYTSSTYRNPARYYPTTSFGIGSVSVTLPCSISKTR